MSHTIKLWKKVIERRLRKKILKLLKTNLVLFLGGRQWKQYTKYNVMELYRMDQNDLHLVFIDLEKTYDRAPREILWKAW